jgi:hypothetical protein
MTLPTYEEIEAAWRAINEAGPMAHDTVDLSMLATKNSRLAGAVRRMADVHVKALGVDPSNADMARALIMGAMVTGLNYGLRISDARVAAVTKERTEPPQELAATERWAWLGRDDQEDVAARTGEIGLKQARTPAAMIPMVATTRSKMEMFWHHAEANARRSSIRIRLCRFTYAETVRETEHGEE